MSDDLNVAVTSRNVFGKGASRRLRRDNLVPAILYGDSKEPVPIQLKHNEVIKHLENEAFYSQLLSVSVDGAESERCILRDVHRHPYKQQILHMDFMRVVAGAEMRFTVPLNFVGEEDCPGVKNEAGIVSHNENEVAIFCLPRNLPENITVDMSEMSIGDAVNLSDLPMPEGVRLADLDTEDPDTDRMVAGVQKPRVEIDPDEEADGEGGDAATGEGDGAAAGGGDGDAAED